MPVNDNAVFAVPVLDRWILTAPLHGFSACVNRNAVAALADGTSERLRGSLAPLQCLRQPPPATTPAPRPGPRPCDPFCPLADARGSVPAPNRDRKEADLALTAPGPRFLSLIPSPQMDPNVAVAAIDWMAALATEQNRSTLDVHVLGAEPLLADDVLDVIVHRTRIAAAGRALEPVLEVTTNGACSESRARFAGDYFSAVILSMDGPAAVGDPAVERTARILCDSRADLRLRVRVSRHDLESLESIASWMCSQFRPSRIDFEPQQRTAESDPVDPYRFAAAFMSAHRAAARWGVEASPRISFRPVGHDAVIVEPDGRLSAGYLNDLPLGRVVNGGLEFDEAGVRRARAAAAPKHRCALCLCRYHCAGGGDDFCVQTRLITVASLLDDLGASALGAALLADRSAAQGLALRASDCLADWDGPHD